MPDMTLQAVPAFAQGTTARSAKLAIETREDLSIIGLAAFCGKADGLAAALAATYSVSPPHEPRAARGNGVTLLWAGPAQWLAIAERHDGRDLEGELKDVAAGLGAVVDHSDGRAVVSVSGAAARKVLGKGFQIDLHARAIKTGDVAITQASHIGVTIWMTDDAPTYTILVPRSYAGSFAGWLAASAAEFMMA